MSVPFLYGVGPLAERFARVGRRKACDTIYKRYLGDIIPECYGIEHAARPDKLDSKYPGFDFAPDDEVCFWSIDQDQRINPGYDRGLVTPRLYPHPHGLNIRVSGIQHTLSPANERETKQDNSAARPQPESLFKGPLSSLADKTSLSLLHDITLIRDSVVVVYVAFIWIKETRVGQCRVFFGSECPLNLYIVIPETIRCMAEAALVGMRHVQTYLISLGLRNLCIISSDQFTLGALGGNFNDSTNAVSSALQVPFIGWRSIHHRFLSLIQEDLHKWCSGWSVHYGFGAVLNHLYESLSHADPLDERVSTALELYDPPEYQALGHFFIHQSAPGTDYHLVDLRFHKNGWPHGELDHQLRFLSGQASQRRAALTMRALSLYLGPYVQNGLTLTRGGSVIIHMHTHRVGPKLHVGHVLFGDLRHPLDLDLLHYNETGDLWACISTLTVALAHASQLGIQWVCVVRQSSDTTTCTRSPFRSSTTSLYTTDSLEESSWRPATQHQLRWGDFMHAMNNINCLDLITCDGNAYGDSRVHEARQGLAGRLGITETCDVRPPKGVDPSLRGTYVIRTGGVLFSEHGGGFEVGQGAPMRHGMYYYAGNHFRPIFSRTHGKP